MTKDELIRQYGHVIWKEVERERDCERSKLTGELDTIIEASGCAPYDWKNSPEGILEYTQRVLPTQTAKDAAFIRCSRLEEISEYSRAVYDLTMRR